MSETIGYSRVPVGVTHSHLNCTFIMPLTPRDRSKGPRWYQEMTHCCWCSTWKLLPNGEWRHWRKGRWLRPLKYHLRKVKR